MMVVVVVHEEVIYKDREWRIRRADSSRHFPLAGRWQKGALVVQPPSRYLA